MSDFQRCTATTEVHVQDRIYTIGPHDWIGHVSRSFNNDPEDSGIYHFEFHRADGVWILGWLKESPLRSPNAVGDLVRVALHFEGFSTHAPGIIASEALEYPRPSDSKQAPGHNVFYEWGRETRQTFKFLPEISPS